MRARKRLKTGSAIIVDVPGLEASLACDVQFASLNMCESEWHEFGGVTDYTAGKDADVVEQTVLKDLELLFERDAGWMQDIGAVNPELQRKWGLLCGQLPKFQLTVLTESLLLFKFVHEIIAKNKLLVKEL